MLVHAVHDRALSARVIRRVAMRYAEGPDPALDRPPYVRAASGIAWLGSELAVIQDDANFIAIVDPATGLARSTALPAGAGGRRLFDDSRGNKAEKLDHEALVAVADGGDTLLVALGSGSTPRRETIVLIQQYSASHHAARAIAAPRFYAALRAAAFFAGSELNVEGATYLDGRLRLFGRGNGAVVGTTRPVNATCDIDWAGLRAHLEQQTLAPPVPTNVVQYDLGSIDGIELSFTDATPGGAGHRASETVFYTAAAEASPDATRDGVVAGSAIGVIETIDGTLTARWTELRDAGGGRFPLKAEGIALTSTPGRLLIVADVDAHDRPSELLEVQLDGA
ncbi:MAG TPA: hypothetical protein VFZ21_29095 [Gemmatimonadaceae bacterium]|nr:hypothetical protein [Gemmatimonadaceae bacterium]